MDNSTHSMSEKLVQYMDGELTGAEKESLEQLLVTDQVLQEELQSLKETRETIKQFGLKEKVAGIHKQMMDELQTPVRKIRSSRRILRYSMAVAASLVLLIGGYLAWNFYSLSSNKVFSANYHSFELTTMRDNDTAQMSPVEKAYRAKNYKEVIILSEQLSTVPVKEAFLAAVSYVEQGNNTKAIERFKKVISANESSGMIFMKDEAEYYLALTYIRNKDFDFALELLRKIKEDPNHTYYKQVTSKLIRQVKMLKWR